MRTEEYSITLKKLIVGCMKLRNDANYCHFFN